MKRSSNQVHNKQWLAIFVFPVLSILLLVSCPNLINAQFLARSSPSLFPQGGVYDVGIIPQSSSGCPVGSEYVTIKMDDEDKKNKSSVTGWTGAISHYPTGTTFGFCRVDGIKFFYNHVKNDYAVLQLGTNCPAGSVSIQRLFDNEDKSNNTNSSSGNIDPNSSFFYHSYDGSGPDTLMYFCFFKGDSTSISSLPDFKVPYGVFAAPSSAWLATGLVHTDDEDSNDPNSRDLTFSDLADDYTLLDFAKIIIGVEGTYPLQGKNTTLRVAKVADGPPCIPCPYIGSYDGANCWVGKPPSGTNAFIWSNNFYYSPVYGATTPATKCPLPGSWFDTANCFVKSIPPGTSPFIWSNMWYVKPACKP